MWNVVLFVVLLAPLAPVMAVPMLLRFVLGLLSMLTNGVSNTSLKVLETRALMHLAGTRRAPAVYRVLCAVPLVGWTVPFYALPFQLAMRLSGFVPPSMRQCERDGRPTDVAQIVAQRSEFIDTTLRQYLREQRRGVAQVVVLGAGFDARAYGAELAALAADGRLLLVEIDTPARSALKQRTLDRAGLDRSHVAFVGANFLEETFVEAMERSNIDGFSFDRPTFVLSEGLFYYLDGESVDKLLTDFREAFAPGSSLVADFPIAAMSFGSSFLAVSSQVVLRMFGEPWLWGLPIDGDDDDAPTRAWPRTALRSSLVRFARDRRVDVAEQIVCGHDGALFGGVARFATD